MKHLAKVLSERMGILAGACWLLGTAGAVPVWAAGAPTPAAGDWPSETVELTDGRAYQGLVESEDQNWVHLIEIQRRPGGPMYLVLRAIDRGSVARIDRLEPSERAELHQRISQFLNRAEIERGKMEAVPLERVPGDGTPRYRYRGKWFQAECTTDEETTRRLIVRIEQMFAAYRLILAQRTEPERPLQLLVVGSWDQYQACLLDRGLKITNRAVFFLSENTVVAGSELARYAAERDSLSAEHQRLREELDQLKQDLAARLQELGEQLKKQGASRKQISRVLLRERGEAEALIERKEGEIARIEHHNDRAFEAVTREMLSRLYHEMFHAYLENYVYPRSRFHVPHWFNEGLAMVFEEGRLESGSLRVDSPHRLAFERLKTDLKGSDPLPLSAMLDSDGRDFLIAHNSSSEESDRLYAYAWGLAYYLAFERQILGRPELDRYLADPSEAVPPVQRFEQLVGMPLSEFEPMWREYVRGLH